MNGFFLGWLLGSSSNNNNETKEGNGAALTFLVIFVVVLIIMGAALASASHNDHYTEYLEWKDSYRGTDYSLPQWVRDTTYEQWCAQRGYKVNEQNRR